MTNATLTIAGRSYSVACAPGEEARIAALGQMIDGKLAGNAALTGQTEARSLLFAALLLADELHDLKQGRPTPAPESGVETAERLESLAEKLELLASRLESAG